MSKFLIRMAAEPLYRDQGAPQTEYRTHERWVQLYIEGGVYHVENGNDRGSLHDEEFKDLDGANRQFDIIKTACGLDEDPWSNIAAENGKLSLEQVVRCFFNEGDILDEGMDDWLERLRKQAHLPYRYKNLYTNAAGFLARAVVWRFATAHHCLQRVEIFFENDSTCHMVKNIQPL